MTNAAAVSYEQLLNWLRLIDESLIEQRTYLTELDSEIGDGDHGTNLARGAAAASSKVDIDQPQFVDELFRLVGMTLISSVGGASGPLYGTFFLRFSLSAGHVTELTGEKLASALEAGVAGVVDRGKAELGDKTMFDAMEPAVRAFRDNLGQGVALAARRAFDAAAQGRDATAELVARKGRASYLGDRSVGHIDPGAASTCLMFEALAEALA
ncbi:MAG TPA: dihydroxyacetone kinase subunit DhaL [Galbitalea sp.]|jgi:dihydroxyacetone kinase-like protein|nr:dihydroxyacetone kinase subunit DhaL [Galbitalea sp.]